MADLYTYSHCIDWDDHYRICYWSLANIRSHKINFSVAITITTNGTGAGAVLVTLPVNTGVSALLGAVGWDEQMVLRS